MRPLVFMVSAIVGSLVTWLGMLVALDAAKIEAVPVSLSMVDALGVLSRNVEASGDQPWVLFLGDSTTLAFPAALESALEQGRSVETLVQAFTIPGETPFDQYFLSQRFVDAAPDCVVLSVNLAAFSRLFAVRFGKIELVGLLTPARLFEACLLPLHWLNATLDQVLLSMAIVQGGALGLWQDLRVEQARVGQAGNRLEAWLRELREISEQDYQTAMGVQNGEDTWMTDGRQRLSPEGSRSVYGEALDGLAMDHPVLRIHAQTLRAFRRAHIPVLVYLVPSDIEYLRELGLVDEDALQLSVTRIGEMAHAQGAAFVDLHDLLPDRVFVDAGGHFAAIDGLDPTSMVIERLLPATRKLLQGN